MTEIQDRVSQCVAGRMTSQENTVGKASGEERRWTVSELVLEDSENFYEEKAGKKRQGSRNKEPAQRERGGESKGER